MCEHIRSTLPGAQQSLTARHIAMMCYRLSAAGQFFHLFKSLWAGSPPDAVDSNDWSMQFLGDALMC